VTTRISFHASHEQFSPRDLLQLVQSAEAAGFDAAFSSDHLQPWGGAQGHSGFVWSWLGAALQATRRLRFSAITIPGGWRYHPVVTAHAIATLAQMFPGRVPWVALGSGEAINERSVGTGWPGKDERDARLAEAATVIRRLLAGETVTHHGHLHVENARLWSLPETPPLLVGAALSEEGARRVARWADGLLTTNPDLAQLKAIIAAYRSAGGEGKPLHLKVELGWARDDETALREAHGQWRFLLAGRRASEELDSPEDFDAATVAVPPAQIRKAVHVAADPARHVAWLRERLALGLATLDLHQVGRDQAGFVETFGREVLPALRQDIAVAEGPAP